MHPVLLKFGFFTIYSYGFMLALAFLAGIALAVFFAKKEGIPPENIFDLSIFVILAAIIGGRTFYVLEFYSDFIHRPLSVFFIWEGGLVFFGGMFFAMLAIYLFAKKAKADPLKYYDAITPAVLVGYAIGRLGCFLNGCCYGEVCSLPWAVQFPLAFGLRHPTQIYSSIAGVMMFVLLYFLYRKKSFDGQIFFSGLLLYSTYRFIMEFLRTNPKYFLGLSEAQWICVVIFIVSVYICKILKGGKK